jgi:hypothetical protein
MKGIISMKKKKSAAKPSLIKGLSFDIFEGRKKKVQVAPIDFEKDLDIDEVIPKELQLQNFFQSEASTPVRGKEIKMNTSF